MIKKVKSMDLTFNAIVHYQILSEKRMYPHMINNFRQNNS